MQLGGVEVEPTLPARKANGEARTAEEPGCAPHLHAKHGEEVRRRGCEASHHGSSTVEAHGAQHRRETAPTQWRAVLASIRFEGTQSRRRCQSQRAA